MKPRFVSMTAVVALLALTGGVRADPPTNERLQRLMARFHKADVNGDGHLTREEAKQGMPRVYEHFAEIDTDNRGYVTVAQIASYAESHLQSSPRHAPSPDAPPTQ